MLEGNDYRCDCNGYQGRLCEDDLDECAATPAPCAAGETYRNYPRQLRVSVSGGIHGRKPRPSGPRVVHAARRLARASLRTSAPTAESWSATAPSLRRVSARFGGRTRTEFPASETSAARSSRSRQLGRQGRGRHVHRLRRRPPMFHWTSATGMLGETGPRLRDWQRGLRRERRRRRRGRQVLSALCVPLDARRAIEPGYGQFERCLKASATTEPSWSAKATEHFAGPPRVVCSHSPRLRRSGDAAANAISPDGQIIAGYGAVGGRSGRGTACRSSRSSIGRSAA